MRGAFTGLAAALLLVPPARGSCFAKSNYALCEEEVLKACPLEGEPWSFQHLVACMEKVRPALSAGCAALSDENVRYKAAGIACYQAAGKACPQVQEFASDADYRTLLLLRCMAANRSSLPPACRARMKTVFAQLPKSPGATVRKTIEGAIAALESKRRGEGKPCAAAAEPGAAAEK